MKIKDMLEVKKAKDAGTHRDIKVWEDQQRRMQARGVLSRSKGPSGWGKRKTAVTGRRQRRAKSRRKSGRS